MPDTPVVTPVKVTPTGIVTTKFSNADIEKIVEKTTKAMDAAGVEKFEVDVYADNEAITGALVFKVNDHWSIDGGVAKPYDGPLRWQAHTRVKF